MKKIRNIFKGDPLIWWCFLGLSIISAVFVFSSIGMVSKGAPVSAWLKHMGFILASWVMAIGISHIKPKVFSRCSAPLLLASIVLLLVVLVMPNSGGVSGRTLTIMGHSIFQPSEIAKIALIISMAKLLSKNQDRLQELGFFFSLMALMVVTAGLIVTENFSTAALVSVICFLMMFFGGVNQQYWWRTFGVVALGAGIFLTINYYDYKSDLAQMTDESKSAALIERSETWAHRVYTWVENDKEVVDQFNMARMAIARGGLVGKGVGNTVIGRLNPQMHSDFIFAFIIEEGGFLFGLLLFVIYAVLCARCIKMANRCGSTFGSLLLGGLGIYIFVQALVHMSYNVGVIPVTGQTLPMVSHGGTSYLMFGVALGMIQSVSSSVKRKEKALREQRKADRSFEETVEIANENK